MIDGVSDGKRILFVDDDGESAELMRALLSGYGFDAVTVNSVQEALLEAALGGFSLFILDNWIGQSAGTDLCQHLRALNRDIPIIFYSGAARETDIQQGLDSGAQAYVVKPDFDGLEQAIRRLIP